MNIVIISGPPAVGKATVAIEFARMTGYTFLINHEISDQVSFDFGTPEFFNEITRLRMKKIKELVKKNSNLVLSFLYFPNENDSFVKEITKYVKKNKGKIMFVQLHSEKSELMKRVKGESRKKFGKLKTVKHLNEALKSRDLYALIPNVESLVIDNTKLSPKRVAQIIISHYKL